MEFISLILQKKPRKIFVLDAEEGDIAGLDDSIPLSQRGGDGDAVHDLDREMARNALGGGGEGMPGEFGLPPFYDADALLVIN